METDIAFNDGSAYERFMGRWSRAVGEVFLDWASPPWHSSWLEVGCGTGAFTELAHEKCLPTSMVAVDPAAAQIDYARSRPIAQTADFRVADAQALPFPDRSFDIVASALVINFIPDPDRAIAEMRRVGRPGGLIAGYVWDFGNGYAPNSSILRGLHRMGLSAPPVPGTARAHLEALRTLFEQTGFDSIETRPIDITVTFRDFDEFWLSQLPGFSPTTAIITALSQDDCMKLKSAVRAQLPISPDGRIHCSARANAIKAFVPK